MSEGEAGFSPEGKIRHGKLPDRPVIVRLGKSHGGLLIAPEPVHSNDPTRNTGINFFDGKGGKFHQKSSLPVITMGRDPDSDVYIEQTEDKISRHHAQVQWLHDGWYLDDLDSKNGTYMQEVPQVLPGMTGVVPSGEWRYIPALRNVAVALGRSTQAQLIEQDYKRYININGHLTEVPLNMPLSLGRSSHNDLSVDTEGVSREHATLIALQDGYLIYDRGSKNGTEISVAEDERPAALEKYIQRGLDLIKQGDHRKAEKHFSNSERAEELGFRYNLGENQYVPRLLTEGDLLYALYKIASKSRPSEMPCYEPKGGSFNNTELFNPELLQRFYYEVGLIFAEEWLHNLQDNKKSLVAGQADKETDIAAYFDKYGMQLSADFITRYSARAEWYIKQHPEREAEIRAFQKAQGRDRFR